MLKRGKSPEFIESYTGMPVHLIQRIERMMETEGSRGAEQIFGLNKEAPIAPCAKVERREQEDLHRRNRDFVAALRGLARAA